MWPRRRFGAWAPALLLLAACQPRTGSLPTPPADALVEAIPSISGTVLASLGGSQTVAITFSAHLSQRLTDLTLVGGSPLPTGWSGPNNFTCTVLSRLQSCTLILTYTPTAAGSGTLELRYAYDDATGIAHTEALTIPYSTVGGNTIVATTTPSGPFNASVGAGSHSVQVVFSSDDGNPITAFALTSSLTALPDGWNSGASSFGCATVSVGNGCALTLSYDPTAAGSGTLMLEYSYVNTAGASETGSLNIPFVAVTGNAVLGTVAPTGQIAVTTGGSQSVTVTFNTNDGHPASAFSVGTDLSSLPTGWSSNNGALACATLSSGNGCQLALTYAPTGTGSGSLNIAFSYTDDTGTSRSGVATIVYTATANDNVVATPSVAGQLVASFGTDQAIDVVFTTDDGNPATDLAVTTNLAALPGGWSSSTGSFSCATLSTGNGCQLALAYAPTTASSGILTLIYRYTNDAGSTRSGSVSLPYSAQGTIGGTVTGLSGAVTLQDNGTDARVLTASGPFTFATPVVSGAAYNVTVAAQPTGQHCTVAGGAGTVTGTISGVSVSCDNNVFSIGGTISGLAADGLSLTDNGSDGVSVLAGTTAFTFATPLAYGTTYAVAIATQPTGETCTASGASGTVMSAVTSANLNCVTNTYGIGGTISGLNAAGLVLTDNGGNALTLSSGASAFTFSSQLAYGTAYAVAVSNQPAGKVCTIGNGSGTATATVNSVSVSCVTGYTLGGKVTGLNVSSVVLANGGVTLTVPANTVPWVFASAFAANSSYAVNVQMQPSGEICQVTSGANGVLTANLSNVLVGCGFGLWTWESGSKTAAASGVYGTLGVAATANVPGGRSAPATWTDGSGNFWMFGGSGLGAGAGNGGYLNDLWEYSPTSGLWTWEAGPSSLNGSGVYGTKGVAASSNVPGSRWRAMTWIDGNGNLWLFGGIGNSASPGASGSPLNDLWKFSPTSGQWTWVSGANTNNSLGTYGTKGVAAAANVPGARSAGVTWIDTNGNLWLLGGTGYATGTSSGALNDLWKFSPGSGQWTWVGGSNSVNVTGTYGTQGTGSASNWPGARSAGRAWLDTGGNVWLFGGSGYGASGSLGSLNDLWEYSSSGTWTWINGPSSTGGTAVFGTQGVAAATNIPGSRIMSCSWIDTQGRLWLFGGDGASAGLRADLWYFTPSSGEWTWVSGSQSGGVSGSYGSLGTAAVSNLPGARQAPSAWLDTSGNLWMFGGSGDDSVGTSGSLNDLWEFHSAQ